MTAPSADRRGQIQPRRGTGGRAGCPRGGSTKNTQIHPPSFIFKIDLISPKSWKVLTLLCLPLARPRGDAARGPWGAMQPLSAFLSNQQPFLSPSHVRISQLLSRFLNN